MQIQNRRSILQISANKVLCEGDIVNEKILTWSYVEDYPGYE